MLRDFKVGYPCESFRASGINQPDNALKFPATALLGLFFFSNMGKKEQIGFPAYKSGILEPFDAHEDVAISKPGPRPHSTALYSWS